MPRSIIEVVAAAKRCIQRTALLCSVPLTCAAQSSKPLLLVYARDPVQTPRPELLELPLPLPASPGHGLQLPWLAAYSCIDSGKLDARGDRVCSPTASASPDAQGRFTAQPLLADAPAHAADPFAEQMLFYHAARSLQFFAALGLTTTDTSAQLHLIANVQLPGPDGLAPWRDASFVRTPADAGMVATLETQAGPAIYFGRDHDVRLAYDSAAIRHEVSHAVLAPWIGAAASIVDAQGTNNAPAAQAEALADYFAAAMVDDPRLGVYAGHGTQAWKIRNLSTPLTCPAALSGSAHEDGLIVASALWALRKQLGVMLDAALVSALQHASAELTTEHFLKRVLDAIAAKQPAFARTARAVFRERGLLPACLRVLELQPGQSLSGAASRFVVPAGEPALPLASSILQLRAAVPLGVSEVELRMRSGTPLALQPALLVLVKASPIRWTAAAAHDAAIVPAAVGGAPGELRFVMPTAGARTLYFQVVNQGQRAAWFDAVRISFRP